MADTSCPYHADHNNRIKKLETNYDELDDRVTALDKEHAISKTEIASSLKSLERLPETMLEISNTMVSIRHEMENSNARLEQEIQGSNSKLGVLEVSLADLSSQVSQIDSEGKVNIRQGFKSWFIKNWIKIGFVLLIASYIAGEIVKGIVK